MALALRLAEAGTTVGAVCRKMGIAEATFYRLKKVCAGMKLSETRRLKQRGVENGKLKRRVGNGFAQLIVSLLGYPTAWASRT